MFAYTAREKFSRNDADLITSKTQYIFSGLWLYNSGYLVNGLQKLWVNMLPIG